MKKLVRKVAASKNVVSRKLIVSNKSNNKKAIMAGAGSGITLEFNELYIDNILQYDVKDNIVTGKADGSIHMTHIGTYYNGGDIEEDLSCTMEFKLEFESAEELQSEIDEYGIDDVITRFGGSSNYKAYIGGGYTHTTFDGVFDIETYSWDDVGAFNIELIDKDFVNYLDRFAHGDNIYTQYEMYINDEPQGNFYDDLDEAVDSVELYADEEDEVSIVRSDYQELYNGDSVLIYDEVVWDNIPDEEDTYDENYD